MLKYKTSGISSLLIIEIGTVAKFVKPVVAEARPNLRQVNEHNFSFHWGTEKKCLFDPGCRDICSSRQVPEAVARSYSVKKVFVKILQNSQENICARVSF